jgi:type II secretory pathway component HofQ
MAPDVQGSVSVQFTKVPWDQAFEEILRDEGLSYRIEGKTLHVFKAAP